MKNLKQATMNLNEEELRIVIYKIMKNQALITYDIARIVKTLERIEGVINKW